MEMKPHFQETPSAFIFFRGKSCKRHDDLCCWNAGITCDTVSMVSDNTAAKTKHKKQPTKDKEWHVKRQKII